MKTSILLFFAGLAFGVAGMLIFGPGKISPKPEPATSIEAATPGTSGTGFADEAQDSKRQLKHSRRKGRKHHAHEPLEGILLALSGIESEMDLDPMLIIRQAARLTRVSESEAIDLLHRLAGPHPEGPDLEEKEFREIISVIVFSRLCELNGPEAMRMVSEGFFRDEMRDAMAPIGMNAWVAADPEGAQRWFEGLAGDADSQLVKSGDDAQFTASTQLLNNDDLRRAYFSGMAKHDPDALEERINGFESEEVRSVMREDMMCSLIAHEQTADGLLEILEKSADLDDSRIAAVEKLAEIDVDQAAEWVAAQAPGKIHDQEITAVATQLMQSDPDNGAKWFMSQQIKDPEMAKNRMSRITYRFANEDLSKAVDWVNRQPDSPIRDHAEVAVAWLHAKQDDWQTSMTWLADVSDRQTRDNTLDQMFRNNWDKDQQSLDSELITAAEAAGFGRAARSYTPD